MAKSTTPKRMAIVKNVWSLAVVMLLTPATLSAQETRPSTAPSDIPDVKIPTTTHHRLPGPGKDNQALAAQEIARLEKELASVSKATDPLNWAKLKAAIGAWWSCAPSGNRTADEEKSLALYREALTVLTPTNNRKLWIDTQGLVLTHLQWLSSRQTPGQAERLKNSIAQTEAFVAQLTREGDAYAWRYQHENLGQMWGALAGVDASHAREHMLKSIDAYEKAFTGMAGSTSDHPAIPGTTQSTQTAQDLSQIRVSISSMIALAWISMPAADNAEKTRNLQNALSACSVALSLLPANATENHVLAQMLCATCWTHMPAADDTQRRLNLTRTLAVCGEILEADPRWERPTYTFPALCALLESWAAMPSSGASGQLASELQEQITICERTLKNPAVKQSAPSAWVWLHLYLSKALAKSAQLPDISKPQKIELLRRAIAGDKAVSSANADQIGAKLAALVASDAETQKILAQRKKTYEDTRSKDDPSYDDIKPLQ